MMHSIDIRNSAIGICRVAPKGNANFACRSFRHSTFGFRHSPRLAPHGMAGFVLANGSRSSNQAGQRDNRRALIEADLVDRMVALPGQLFYSTQIPVTRPTFSLN